MPLESPLFNRTRWRAKRKKRTGDNFLFDFVAKEAAERLDLIQRTFKRGLLYGSEPLTPLADKSKVVQWFHSDGAGTADFICDDESLPLRDNSFDLIAHLLMLHHANQLPHVLQHIHRVLQPDGLLLACLFAPDTLHELKTCLLQAELEIKGGVAQRVIPLTDIRTLGNLLQASGFALPVADLSSVEIHYKSMAALLRDLRSGAETQNLNPPPPFLRRDVLKRAEALYQQQFATPEGKLRATFHFAWLIGWKPHPSQPKPLARGSGKASFADAVKKNP